MDQPTENANEQPEWFENVLDQYDYQSPKPGQLLEGTILSIEEDGILVDIGRKRDGLIPARDIEKVDNLVIENLSVGDQIMVYVLNSAIGDRELLVSLSKGIEHQSWIKAQKYLEENVVVELDVIGHNRGGFLIQFEMLRGFLPFSLAPEIQKIRSIKRAERIKNEIVGTKMELKIIEVERQRNRLIFSAMAALEEKRKQRMQELEKGQIISGQVVSIVDFGAFVDLGGVDGLVHISQLDWKKVKNPSEVVKVGDDIDVKIIDVDLERERISLSRKALLPSPWDLLGESLQPGDYIEGRITRLVDFGAFVELPVGVEGLIHISQIGYSSAQDPQTAVKPGETVLLRVLEINPERKRIALSMRQVPLERQIAWAMEHLGEEAVPITLEEEPKMEDVPEETAQLKEEISHEPSSTKDEDLPDSANQIQSETDDQETETPEDRVEGDTTAKPQEESDEEIIDLPAEDQTPSLKDDTKTNGELKEEDSS